MGQYKPTLCLDFDGVIHSYTSGWQGVGRIVDTPVPGAVRFIISALHHFNVAIYSSRSKEEKGIAVMKAALCTWIQQEMNIPYKKAEDIVVNKIQWPTDKPPAHLTIDDRAWCFEGTFPSIEEIKEFKPWNKRQSPKS